jgi:ATP/maltotriose-dependent transcriptional regulator MalT
VRPALQDGALNDPLSLLYTLRITLTEGTVKNHVSNLLAKLQAENRTQAADIARRRGLV